MGSRRNVVFTDENVPEDTTLLRSRRIFVVLTLMTRRSSLLGATLQAS
jgi:hypothetical protein